MYVEHEVALGAKIAYTHEVTHNDIAAAVFIAFNLCSRQSAAHGVIRVRFQIFEDMFSHCMYTMPSWWSRCSSWSFWGVLDRALSDRCDCVVIDGLHEPTLGH